MPSAILGYKNVLERMHAELRHHTHTKTAVDPDEPTKKIRKRTKIVRVMSTVTGKEIARAEGNSNDFEAIANEAVKRAAAFTSTEIAELTDNEKLLKRLAAMEAEIAALRAGKTAASEPKQDAPPADPAASATGDPDADDENIEISPDSGDAGDEAPKPRGRRR